MILLFTFFAVFFFVFYNKKKKNNRIHNSTKKRKLLKIIIVALLIIVIFIPFEAPYARFESAENSINYSTLNHNIPIKVIESEKTSFAVLCKENKLSFYSIIKYEDKFGFCNYHSSIERITDPYFLEDDDFVGTISIYKLTNYETEEKCFMIVFLKSKGMDSSNIIVYDAENNSCKNIINNEIISVFSVIKNVNKDNNFFYYNDNKITINE